MEINYVRTVRPWSISGKMDFDYIATYQCKSRTEYYYFFMKEPKVTLKVERLSHCRPIIIKTPSTSKIVDIDFFIKNVKGDKVAYKNIRVSGNSDRRRGIGYLWKRLILYRKLKKVVYKISHYE